MEEFIAEFIGSSEIAELGYMEPFVEKVGALGEVVNLLVGWKSIIPFLQTFEVDTCVHIDRISTGVNVCCKMRPPVLE